MSSKCAGNKPYYGHPGLVEWQSPEYKRKMYAIKDLLNDGAAGFGHLLRY